MGGDGGCWLVGDRGGGAEMIFFNLNPNLK